MPSALDVHGTTAPGFGPLADAFTRNFRDEGEIGAACSVYADGEPVADLWGGLADASTGAAWTDQTIVMVYSAGKGLAAVCAHLLAQRGDLDLDQPVASYWPEFAAHGKAGVTTRMILGHRAGLPVIDRRLTQREVLAVQPVVSALAGQAPAWPPGTRHGYHLLTFGWLIGEIVRRVTGQTLGAFFAGQIAAPLGLNAWIGLPASEEHRVSALIPFTRADLALVQHRRGQQDGEARAAAAALNSACRDPASLTMRASTLNGAMGTLADHNSREFHASEIPSVNAISDARSLARTYAACVGQVGGHRVLDSGAVEAATEVASDGPDAILFTPTRFGLGFFLPAPAYPMLGPTSFGHPGMGGALAFGDLAHRVGFGYVMNKLGAGFAPLDLRAGHLVAVLRGCLGG
jgi:CubicO group peptidase (beta-lactamase class C family)